jgi:hypothetical protein
MLLRKRVDDGAFDVVLASLSLMYVLDQEAAGHEIACVLRLQGRMVAAVWVGPIPSDLVSVQAIARHFAPPRWHSRSSCQTPAFRV